MNYREKHTTGFISNFIKSFWQYESSNEKCNYEILPDGFFDLIFEIQNEQVHGISLTGVWTKQVNISIPENTKLIGVRFKLIADEYIFKRSIKELKDSSTELPVSFWNCEKFDVYDFEEFTDSIMEKLQYKLKKCKKTDDSYYIGGIHDYSNK